MFRVDIKYPTRSDRNYWFYSRSYNFLILYNRFKRYFIIPVFLFHLLICIIILKTKQAHTHRTTYQSIYTIWQVRRRIKKRRKDRAFKSFLPSNIKPIISKFISLFKYRFPRILGYRSKTTISSAPILINPNKRILYQFQHSYFHIHTHAHRNARLYLFSPETSWQRDNQ